MPPSVEVLNMTAATTNEHQFNDDPLVVSGPVDGSALAAAAGVVNNSNSNTPVGSAENSLSPSPASGNDTEITRPGEHDVLLGRGGGTNNHSGNIKFRKLVNEHKMRYLACSKVDKPKVAREVVQLWRKMTPPGRFLARRDDTKRGPGSVKAADNVWYEVGDKKAREKASQCLRERTPDVMPYIKQLREQQDAITEHGVSLVQQQLQMQQQHHHPHHPHASQQHAAAAHQQQHHHAAAHQQQQQQQHHQARLMGAPQQAAGYVDYGNHHNAARPAMGTQPFPGRRTSMPGPPEPAMMGHQQQQLHPGQQMYNRSQQQQQQQHAFGNNNSGHRLNNGAMMNQQQQQQQMMVGQQQQQQQQQQPMGDFYEPVPFGATSAGANTNTNGTTADMSELEYQQNMMMMQQQVQMQQMQMQRMQQQRLQQRQQQQRQQQQLPNGAYAAFPNSNAAGDAADDSLEPFPVQSDPLMGLSAEGFRRQDSDGGSSSNNNKTPPTAASPASPNATSNKNNNSPSKSPTKRGRDEPPERVAPDRAPTSTSLMSYTPIAATADNDATGEMTIEEYRKQLEAYIENIENSNNNNNNNEGGNGAVPAFGGGDDEYASDLEDDWEKEREKNLRSDSNNNGGGRQRGVNRNTSGMSFMSTKTTKTNMSMISGLSASLFSDLNSTDGGTSLREQKMNATRSVCSNLSLMSELTDLSENIDKLGLDDDE